MKNLKFTCLAAGVLLLALGGCSSSTTESTTASTAEEVTTDKTTATPPAEVLADIPYPKGGDSLATFADSTSFHALAASIDLADVLASVQAKSRGTQPEVKKFAEDMISDHTKTNEELKKIATMRGLALPTSPVGTHQRMLNKVVNEKDANEFDEEYMDLQITLHKQAVELYESAAKHNSDPELKAFANRMLPAMRHHLDMAKSTRALVK